MERRYFYSSERNVQILVALLKAKGIRRVVASPGATNVNFVWSVQQDPFFEVFSAVDERHAAYLACGMAAESGEPVVLSCTGATSSRNYLPGLTEAYYRKLPILAVTSSQPIARLGNLSPQMTDRTAPPSDAVRCSVQCPVPATDADAAACAQAVNKALIALTRHGGGPAHINLETHYSGDFSVKELPAVRVIRQVMPTDAAWPELPQGRVGVRIGAHRRFTEAETAAIEAFAKVYDAAVFVDHTSGYAGPSAVHGSFLLSQGGWAAEHKALFPEVLIHIGEVSGDYPALALGRAKEVWRVSEDGEARDLMGKLTAVFEMPEAVFFRHYVPEGAQAGAEPSPIAQAWHAEDAALRARIPELPFSNPWLAQRITPELPAGCAVHLGILNSLRSWNLFPLPAGVESACNVGGFGIDGIVSTVLGASLAAPGRRFFAVVGDLAFFYDLNALGNRHVGKNLRILLVNNAAGAEFHLYNHAANRFGPETATYMAADGHFANQSRDLVRHYATDLGLGYRAADSKAALEEALPWFLGDSDRSLVLECFTRTEDESEAHRLINTLVPHQTTAREAVSAVLPQGVKDVLKRVLK